jgi:hypothetical protein
MLYIIADMKKQQKRSGEEMIREIEEIRQGLLALGAMHPGSVSRQYQVCRKPGCKCMHPKEPVKHGPYHKLAYVHKGRPVCRFVRADCVEALAVRLAEYKKFRSLVDRWVELSIRQGEADFFTPCASKAGARKPREGKGAKKSNQ